jgi:DNA-3-methyladenine glycosylase
VEKWEYHNLPQFLKLCNYHPFIVYRIYEIHQCVNIVTEEIGRGAAVLLRALEPLCGIEAMMAHRGTRSITALCNGPAKLAQALQFTILPSSVHPCEIATSSRIGITKAATLPLRFFIPNSRFVSQGKPSV